jgi:hypothetical protein
MFKGEGKLLVGEDIAMNEENVVHWNTIIIVMAPQLSPINNQNSEASTVANAHDQRSGGIHVKNHASSEPSRHSRLKAGNIEGGH